MSKIKKTKTKKVKVSVPVSHKLLPLHIFHNEQIDRWIVLMECQRCEKIIVFYPWEREVNPCKKK